MTNETFEEIRKAIELLQSSTLVGRIDGDGWKVYRVGKIIRVDIKNE